MELTEVARLRRAVLRNIAHFTWNDTLPEDVHDILYTVVTPDTPRLRCCIHKERAVLRNRIQMALGQKIGLGLTEAAKKAISEPYDKSLPVVDVLPDACDACPIEKYYVTDICRHCISHKCMNNCPKKAITIKDNRAHINRELCIECGNCHRSCPYGAIIEITRPCVKACALGAISAGEHNISRIDYEKCVHCGNCRRNCPFGAIDERSMMVQVMTSVKQGKKVIAMVAPSISGQFGMKITMGQIISSLKKVGFADVVEVGVGADLTAIHEAQELVDKVPAKQPFMTSSCCPAFVDMIKKNYPNSVNLISETVSPMVATARWVKDAQPDALVCFIGPCIAKKAESQKYPDDVDFVMTYEECQCMLEGIGIDPAKEDDGGYKPAATKDGIGFPLNKGVTAAVVAILAKQNKTVKGDYACGLSSCHAELGEAIKGKKDIEYFEGMACQNGCVDGPGALALFGMTRVLVTKYGKTSATAVCSDNELIKDKAATLNLEVKHH